MLAVSTVAALVLLVLLLFSGGVGELGSVLDVAMRGSVNGQDLSQGVPIGETAAKGRGRGAVNVAGTLSKN